MIDASILIYKAYSTFILKLVAHNITRRPSDYRLMRNSLLSGIPTFTSHTDHDGSTKPHHKVRCVDGWTQWMSGNTPSTSDINDHETSDSLRKLYSFCYDSQQRAIECRVANQPTQTSPPVWADYSCDLKKGLNCISKNGIECPNYEIRFECDCSKY